MSPAELEAIKLVAGVILTGIRTGQSVNATNAINEQIMSSLPDDTTDAERWEVEKRLLRSE